MGSALARCARSPLAQWDKLPHGSAFLGAPREIPPAGSPHGYPEFPKVVRRGKGVAIAADAEEEARSEKRLGYGDFMSS